MAKRGRPSKAQRTLLISQHGVQTSANRGIIDNEKLDPQLSKISHAGRKKQKTHSIIRRSPRMHNAVGNQELEPAIQLEPIIHEIYISENMESLEPLQREENKSTEVESPSEETERCSKKGNSGVSDGKYKTMYMSSQKKIEDLLDENRELSKALEFANGKVHGYEKQGDVYSEVVAVIASLSRVNENLSARVNQNLGADEEFDKRKS